NVLPWRREIIDSLLDCDLVGFHIPRYAKNFADVARSLNRAEIEAVAPVEEGLAPTGTALSEPEVPASIRTAARSIRLGVTPVGTNPDLVESYVKSEASQALQKQLLDELGGRRLLITVG